jgi:adenosine deaminase
MADCRSTRSSRRYSTVSARGRSATGISVGFIVTAMRQFARSVEVAELAVRHRDGGVVGFDVAGPEAGFPPTRYLDAFNLIHQATST